MLANNCTHFNKCHNSSRESSPEMSGTLAHLINQDDGEEIKI